MTSPSFYYLRRSISILLVIAASVELAGCGVIARSIREGTTGIASPGPRRAEWGRVAWEFFRSGRNGKTGLVEVSAGAGFATPESIADHIAAAVSAHRLGIITERELDAHVSPLLKFLSSAPLSNGTLPGRYYSVGDGALMDPPRPGVDPGWSAAGVGRLLFWLRMLIDRHPQYEPYVVRTVARWRTCEALDPIAGPRRALPAEGGLRIEPETDNAYAFYGAQGFAAWGSIVPTAPAPTTDATMEVAGIALPLRDPAHAPIMTAPYALLAIETGWTSPSGKSLSAERSIAGRVLAAQARRTAAEGIVTARTDYRRQTDPYEVIDSVLDDGYPWNTATRDGRAVPELALISTRAAWARWALEGLSDGDKTLEAVSTLYNSESGWYEGRYEKSGGQEATRTSATNAFVLEALLYREVGALFDGRRPLGFVVPRSETSECRLPDLKVGQF